MHLHATKLITSVKGGARADFGALTFIQGPNATGKSTYIYGLTLALAGIGFDLVGRDEVKDPRALYALVTPGQPLESIVRLSDGREASYKTTQKKDGGVKDPEHVAPVRVRFPVREVLDGLTGSTDKAREFLLGRVAGRLDRAQIHAAMTPSLRETYDTAVERIGIRHEGAALLAVTDDCAKRARDLRREAKTLREAAARAQEGLPPEPAPEEIVAAEQRLAELRESSVQARVASAAAASAESVASARAAVLQTRTVLEQEVQASQESLARAGEAAEAARAAWLALPPVDAAAEQLAQARATVLAAARLHLENRLEACLCCGRLSPDYSAVQQIVDRLESAARQDAVAGTERAAREADVAQRTNWHRAQYDRAFQAIERLNAFLASPGYQQTLAAEPVAVLSVSADTAIQEAQILDAEEVLQALQSASRAWDIVHVQETDAKRRDTEAEQLDELGGACEKAIGRALDKATVDFTAAVQSFLPDTDRFALQLRDGKKEVCRFGLARSVGGKTVLHTALSGAEWARVTFALACATAGEPDPNTLNLFVPPDRPFDPVTLRAVLDAIARNPPPGQVIWESPVMPEGGVPEGWTVIQAARAEGDAGSDLPWDPPDEEAPARPVSGPTEAPTRAAPASDPDGANAILAASGWSKAARQKLNANSRLIAAARRIAPTDVTVLRNGSLFDNEKKRLVPFTSPTDTLPDDVREQMVGLIEGS